MRNKFFSTFIFFIFLPHCSYLQKSATLQNSTLQKSENPSITFKTEQVFEKNKTFKGLKVGGLSGLVFDKSSGNFYALSDDKKNSRFYELTLKTHPEYKFEIKNQFLLKSPGHNLDPEALVLYKDNTIFIASEGQQTLKVHEPPQIFTFDKKGVLKKAWPVPPVFWKKVQNKQATDFGSQENKGFESLSLDERSDTLWTATEKPLKQDLISKDNFLLRLSAFDIKKKEMLIQYPYPLKNKATGLTALHFLKPKTFISLERAYKKEKKKGVNKVYLFLTDCRQASNIQSIMKLQKKIQSCSKELLFDFSKSLSVKVDNLEALALGPILPSKKQLMVFISDNNFNEDTQKTQFLFFELDTKNHYELNSKKLLKSSNDTTKDTTTKL